MSKTPRMDSAFKQLTSTTPRMNWQLDQCYREGCKLERELKNAREIVAKYEDRYFETKEQRDRLAEELDALKEETLESMYAKVVSVALDCDPIAAKDRADDKLEPPWEVFARVKRERDIWIAEAERWRKNTDLYHTVLGQRDSLAEALREIDEARLDDFMGPHDMALKCVLIARESLAAVEGGSHDH